MKHSTVSLDEAVDATRTGDLWLFRGGSGPDRAIRVITNAPINHVGMAVVIDDLPPMMWHAELGQALPDLWAGKHHRGVQLHDLRGAVERWSTVYHQRAWLRQLHPTAGRAQEDALMRVIARWDGTSFPKTAALTWRWLLGRSARLLPGRGGDPEARAEAAYCAEVVAATYIAMGLLDDDRPTNWYDPGRFWSGDELALIPPWSLGSELDVSLTASGAGQV